MNSSTELRPELTAMPARIAALPRVRGYPIPWFVDWVNGQPEFRTMDGEKRTRAILGRLCWVCGERLGKFMSFVTGPMCGINRTSAEPPCHHECALWSALNCPFLSRPQARRREEEGFEDAPGFAIKRNPGVTMLWTTNDYKLFKDRRSGVLLHLGDPSKIEWYREGRPATRIEILESIETGLPFLMELAQQEEGAVGELLRMTQAFIAHRLPVERSKKETPCPS